MSIMFPDKPSVLGRLKLILKKILAKIGTKLDEHKEASDKVKELKLEAENEAQIEYDLQYKKQYKERRISEAKAKAIKKANEPPFVVSALKLIGSLGTKSSNNSRSEKPQNFSTLLWGDPQPKNKEPKKEHEGVKWF